LLTLLGWTSGRIAEAFGVREDTVQLWRSDFVNGGVEALKARVAPGPTPAKAQAALRVAAPLLSAPGADRHKLDASPPRPAPPSPPKPSLEERNLALPSAPLATERSPGFIPPCEPALVVYPPVGPGWLHEHDGFRILALKQGERVTLVAPTSRIVSQASPMRFAAALDQLYPLRQRGEELSDVILRLAQTEAAKRGRRRRAKS
jgi:hypothetical protein